MTAKDMAIVRSARGYAMAALLVALSVMSVLLAVAMPVWKQASQREKEAELIFRGQQYARAIGLFQRRAGPGALPPNVDVLVEQRFLRKKYKDPITNDDFQPLLGGQQAPGGTGGAAGPGGAGAPVAPGGAAPPAGRGAPPVAATPGAPGSTAIGGIQGVVSKSKAKSIRLYNGRGAYNEWAFVFVPQQQAAGPGGAQNGRGGGRGGTQPPVNPQGPGGGGFGGVGGPGGGRGGAPPTTPFGPRGAGGQSGGPGPFPPGGRR